MFTGLVEEVAKVRSITKNSQGARLCVEASFSHELQTGDSVAINGVCQTVVKVGKDWFEVEAMPETLRLVNLSDAKTVNLERAMPASGRFGGHFVSGHIDGMAKFLTSHPDGISHVMRFNYPMGQMVLKGSVCVNGVSLTISAMAHDYFEVSVIPHTFQNTNLKDLKAGDAVNIETDIIAKYVEKMLAGLEEPKKTPRGAINENFLKEHGF